MGCGGGSALPPGASSGGGGGGETKVYFNVIAIDPATDLFENVVGLDPTGGGPHPVIAEVRI
jgi:hypothetical protein